MSDKERHRINETDPVLDPEAGGPVQRAIGQWLLSVTSINPLVPGGRRTSVALAEAVFWNIVYGFPGRGTRAISVIGASNNTTTNHLVHNTEVCTVGNDFTWQPVAIFYNRRSRLLTATLNT